MQSVMRQEYVWSCWRWTRANSFHSFGSAPCGKGQSSKRAMTGYGRSRPAASRLGSWKEYSLSRRMPSGGRWTR